MAHGEVTRRALTAMIGAGAAWPLAASAIVLDPPGQFHLNIPGALDGPYAPPKTLATVADLYSRMTTKVLVNGQGPFAFVVDTGANQSVISKALAERLGLPAGPTEALNGVAGSMMAPTTTAALAFGDISEPDVLMSILPGEAMGGDGILGLDRVEGQRLIMDFRRRTLSIERRAARWRDPTDVVLKARRRDGQLTLVDADLAGMRLVALLDSGAQMTIGNMALYQMALSRAPTSVWTQTAILSATGQTMMSHMADLPHLRLGTLHFPNWPVAFADLHTFRMWGMIDKPAILLGVDVLSRFEYVSLDFARDEVRFRVPHEA